METDCRKARDAKSLEIERVFETSRMAGELMACAYENLVPILRRSLNAPPQWESSHRPWGQLLRRTNNG